MRVERRSPPGPEAVSVSGSPLIDLCVINARESWAIRARFPGARRSHVPWIRISIDGRRREVKRRKLNGLQ